MKHNLPRLFGLLAFALAGALGPNAAHAIPIPFEPEDHPSFVRLDIAPFLGPFTMHNTPFRPGPYTFTTLPLIGGFAPGSSNLGGGLPQPPGGGGGGQGLTDPGGGGGQGVTTPGGGGGAFASTPEPSGALMVGVALLSLAAVRRIKRRTKARR